MGRAFSSSHFLLLWRQQWCVSSEASTSASAGSAAHGGSASTRTSVRSIAYAHSQRVSARRACSKSNQRRSLDTVASASFKATCRSSTPGRSRQRVSEEGSWSCSTIKREPLGRPSVAHSPGEFRIRSSTARRNEQAVFLREVCHAKEPWCTFRMRVRKAPITMLSAPATPSVAIEGIARLVCSRSMRWKRWVQSVDVRASTELKFFMMDASDPRAVVQSLSAPSARRKFEAQV